jgi:hypothetical protein
VRGLWFPGWVDILRLLVLFSRVGVECMPDVVALGWWLLHWKALGMRIRVSSVLCAGHDMS